MQIAYVDGPRLRRSLIAACEYAQRQRAELNRINVFPVPDGDTGTNLALTVRAIADHLRGNRDRAVSAVAHDAAQGAVLGARGNCGMMLSHFLLGFADSVSDRRRIGPGDFGAALHAGVDRLYESLEDPVEGTILSVMRDAARAARSSADEDFVPLVGRVVEEARDSLARTPEQLAVLKRAGVVDAGAKGFVSMLEGVWLLMQGAAMPDGNGDGPRGAGACDGDGSQAAAAAMAEYPTEEEQYRFCTEALVRGGELPGQDDVQAVLAEHGDSLIVIRADDVLKIHVHTDEPEAVFDYLRGLGTLATHKAEDMRVQHEALGDGHIRLARRPVTVVTDSAADLPEEVVRAHGIHVVPLQLVDDDRTYRDGIDITAAEFQEKLRTAEALPTTSQPPPGAFLEAYGQAGEEGESVVGIFLSSTLSGTLAAAEAAASRAEGDDIHVVDSLGNSLLQGLLALKAAELGEAGRSVDEIITEVRRIRARSGILFTVSTFDRLIASGRVSMGKALLGRFLGLKPILGMTADGRIEAFGKAFGDERARPRLLSILADQIPDDAGSLRFGIVHVGIPEVVEPVARALRDRYGAKTEILSAPAAPVISTHLGIGAWGVAYMVED